MMSDPTLDKLKFYNEKKIAVKFRLKEPKSFLESRGTITKLEGNVVILKFKEVEIINFLEEIDLLTIYPMDYNAIVEPVSSYISEAMWNFVMNRDGWLCKLKLDGCTNKAEVCDHIIARVNGGLTIPENLQASCIHCNSKKGSKTFI